MIIEFDPPKSVLVSSLNPGACFSSPEYPKGIWIVTDETDPGDQRLVAVFLGGEAMPDAANAGARRKWGRLTPVIPRACTMRVIL